MKRTCQLAAVQVYLVLQYEFLLPLNLHQPHQKRCVSKVLRQLLAAQQAPESQRGALAIWFPRERPKKFQKDKENPIWFVICEWHKWRRIFRECWPEEKGHEYWLRKKKRRKKKLCYGDAGEVVNVCQWKTPTSNNTGLIKVMTHSLCPPPSSDCRPTDQRRKKRKKKKLSRKHRHTKDKRSSQHSQICKGALINRADADHIFIFIF